MKSARLFLIFILVSVFISGSLDKFTSLHVPSVTSAQSDDSCDTLVQQALSQAANVCLNLGRNEACLASPTVNSSISDSSLFFDTPGDIISVEALQSVITQPADPNSTEWGIVIMDLSVDLPEDSDGVVRLLLYGGVEVASDTQNVSNQFSAPMQAITLQMDETATCQTAPSGMLIQSPSGQTATLLVNNVELRVGSTAFLTLRNNNRRMTIANLQGNVSITSNGMSREITSGFSSSLGYDDDGEFWGEPEPPFEFGDAYEDVDFDHLDELIDLEGFDPDWFDNPFVLIDGIEGFDPDEFDGLCDEYDTSRDCIDAFFSGEIDGYRPRDYLGDFDCVGFDCFDALEDFDHDFMDDEYDENEDFDDEDFNEEFDEEFEDDEMDDDEEFDEDFEDDEFEEEFEDDLE